MDREYVGLYESYERDRKELIKKLCDDDSYFSAFYHKVKEMGFLTDETGDSSFSFGSIQQEHMYDQELVDIVCRYHNVDSFTLGKIGGYYDWIGAVYVLYNDDSLGYEEAKRMLDEYAESQRFDPQ